MACAVLAVVPAVASASSAKVMTWNVQGSQLKLNGVVGEIRKRNPDVVGLQEICVAQLKEIRNELANRGLRYWMRPGSVSRQPKLCPKGEAFGQGMLSKRAMSPPEVVPFPERKGYERRGVMAVTIKLGRRSVRVFNTHIGLRSDTAPQIKQVAQMASKPARALVLGDFNVDPTRPEIQPMFRRFSENRRGPWTKDYEGNRVKIDYVFRKRIRAVRTRVFDTPASDHRPLVVTVRRP